MELPDTVRNAMITAIRTAIDSGGVGIFRFYDKNDVAIVDLQLASSCMTVVSAGTGTFNDTAPYLKGTVPVGQGGLANRWKIMDHLSNVILAGSCGDPSHVNRDIQFNTLNWSDYDNISVTGLTITVPSGSNSYIP